MGANGISERLNEPYASRVKKTPGGGGSDEEVTGGGPGGYYPDPDKLPLPVSIAGRSFLVDTSRQTNQQERFRRQSVQLLNTQQNTDKGESALTTPEIWRRTSKSWHHGMGQKFAERDDSDEYRYDWSKGINPWERWEITLLHRTEQKSSNPTFSGVQANGHTVALRSTKQQVFVTDGDISTTLDFTYAQLIATDGYYLYALGTDAKLRVYEIVNNGLTITMVLKGAVVTVPLAGDQPNLMFVANYKLIVTTESAKVYDLTAFITAAVTSGTVPALPKPVYTPPVPGEVFVSGCAGKKALYAMSVNGDKTIIHGFTLTRGSGDGPLDVLLYDGVAAELPDGELGNVIYNYLGYIAIGTSKGFRFAVLGEGITYGPLIETPNPVTAFEGQSRFLYYALSGFRDDNGIGRADLSQFVDDLQPAYASDLMSGVTTPDRVTFINTLANGKTAFGLASGGVYIESDLYVPQGQIVTSKWTFNVVDPKLGMYVNTHTSVGTGGKGRAFISYDTSANEYFLGEFLEAQQRFNMTGATFYSAQLRAELEPNDDATATPKIYSTEIRCTYIRGKASEWQVPCILHDEIEMDNGTVIGRDVLDDYRHLLFLVESGQQFHYVEDGKEWTVYATDFIWSPQERSQTAGWQGVFTIYFREVR